MRRIVSAEDFVKKYKSTKGHKGRHELALESLPKGQHAAYKSAVLAQIKLPKKFTLDGVTVTITAGPRVHDNGKWVEVELTAERNGTALKVDNPYQFENPPIKHHDGTWRQELDPRTNEMHDVPNMVEDPLSTLQRIIVDAVLSVAK